MSSTVDVKVIRRRTNNVQPSAPSVQATPLCEEREKCRELLESLIRGLVDYPETIAVTYAMGDRTTVYKVDCDQRCLGQIIGAKGRNISGVRAVITATMARKGIRAIVEIPYFCLDT